MAKKLSFKVLAFTLALLIFVALCPLALIPTATYAEEKQEITKVNARIHQVDASVQLPYNYASIIGFKVTVKLLKDKYDKWEDQSGETKYCGYGGKDGEPDDVDPDDPTGDKLGHFACYMLNAFRGKHGVDELNENTYGVEKEGDNYEKLLDSALAKQEIVKFGMGEGNYVAGYLDNGRGPSNLQNTAKGDTVTIPYQGKTALFEQGNPYLTFFGYTSEFEIISIEWVTGTPVVNTPEEWDTVEKEVINDVSTVENAVNQNGFNYVNITKPKNGEGPFPVVLWIHGGAWTTSSRTDVILNMNMEYLLAQGYAFVSCEYTLNHIEEDNSITSLTQGKQMVYDLKLAVRFLRANAEKYNLDTKFICAMGESAGAHLSLLLATTNGSSEHEAANTAIMDWKDYSSDVQAAVSYSGPSDMTGDSADFLVSLDDYKNINKAEVSATAQMMAYTVLGSGYFSTHVHDGVYDDEAYEAAAFMSPYSQVNADTPPIYLIHGQKDEAVPVCHAYAMEEQAKVYMKESDVKATYYPDAVHVDKSYFDVYAQYSETAKFITEQAKKYGLFGGTAENPDKDSSGSSTSSDSSSKKGCGSSVSVGIATMTAGFAMAAVVLKRKKNCL